MKLLAISSIISLYIKLFEEGPKIIRDLYCKLFILFRIRSVCKVRLYLVIKDCINDIRIEEVSTKFNNLVKDSSRLNRIDQYFKSIYY